LNFWRNLIMLKAIFFGIALIGAAVITISTTAFLAVLFLFSLPANAASPVYLLEPTTEEQPEEVEETIVVNVTAEEKIQPVFLLEAPVFLLEAIEVPTDAESPQEVEKPLKDMTVAQLKELAKKRGVRIKSSLRKAQIIGLLSA